MDDPESAIREADKRPQSAELLAESTYLRGEALDHIAQIKAFLKDLEGEGGPTLADLDFVKAWLEIHVVPRQELAAEKDRKREAIIAGEIVTSASRGGVVVDKHNTVMTSREVAEAQAGNSDLKK
jgi:hypothetical protein